MCQNIGGVKFWQIAIYAYQTFGDNKLANHLCSAFKIFQRQILITLNFGELTTICQILQCLKMTFILDILWLVNLAFMYVYH